MSFQLETGLTPQDRQQLKARGIPLETIEQQLATFRRGIPFVTLKRPCRPDDGIRCLDSLDVPALIRDFERARAAGRITKFVPASGVGTRMFESLKTARLHQEGTAGGAQRELEQFFRNLPKFAFYHDLKATLLRQGSRLDQLMGENNYRPVIDALLDSLNYANLPKGLIAFHRYATTTRTAIEEHLVEAADYARDDRGCVRIHFTVSPDHERAIKRHSEQAHQRLVPQPVTWLIDCSVQNPSMDTIAVTMDNRPFHDSRGNLLFRPAGHGALLSNLHDLHGDVVFIKNIDNVVPDHLKDTSFQKIMGGLLVGVQDTLFAFLSRLESDSTSSSSLKQIAEWARHSLAMTVPEEWDTFTNSQKARWLFTWLNRPLRICGMVPDTTHPGGGPFWVEQKDGSPSLQIVESSQIDPTSPQQQAIVTSSTHCNPVDMVCGIRDYRGNPFNLHQFIDPDTGFISKKSHEGEALKALERPGLWNGGMAKWHSVFIEVPRRTFNPVKTVMDLLRPEHQPPEPS